MTLLPFIACSQMLDIDLKTLRQWVRQANVQLHSHPSDARVKGLLMEQLHQVATLHGRVLKSFPAPSPPPADAPELDTSLASLGNGAGCEPEVDMRSLLVRLEAHVNTMQHQLTQLALQLLEERTMRYEQRLQRLEERFAFPMPPSPQPSPPRLSAEQQAAKEESLSQSRRPSPRKGIPTRVLPLIEYSADGSYVVICPTQGELALTPESQEWFAWLSMLTSFRFVGQYGRFSTNRKRGRSSWMAYRRIQGHVYAYSLGNTQQLTLAHLEQMAATLQSCAPSL